MHNKTEISDDTNIFSFNKNQISHVQFSVSLNNLLYYDDV